MELKKVTNAFFVEKDVTDEKRGVQSPKNEKFYAYIWDAEAGKCVAHLVSMKDVEERNEQNGEQARIKNQG